MVTIAQIPPGTLIVTFLALTAIIALRYLMISGLFYWLLWGRAPEKVGAIKLMEGWPKPGAVRREIGWSLASSFIYAAPAAVVFEIWRLGGSAVYLDINEYPLWYVPVSIVAYLFLHDTYFYWTHRMMHLKPLFSVMHKVHHESRPPTPWAAFSFHPYESVVGAIFLPLLALFIPIHVGAILFILTVMTLAAVLNHSGWDSTQVVAEGPARQAFDHGGPPRPASQKSPHQLRAVFPFLGQAHGHRHDGKRI